jgi:hypothetical protein
VLGELYSKLTHLPGVKSSGDMQTQPALHWLGPKQGAGVQYLQ